MPYQKDRSATGGTFGAGPDTADEHAISLAVSGAFRQFSVAGTWSAQSPIKREVVKVVGNSRKSRANQLEKHSKEPVSGPKWPNSAMLRVGLVESTKDGLVFKLVHST